MLAATTPDEQAINRVYNVACGETTSLNELFASIKTGLRAFAPSVENAAPVHEGFRQGDIRRSSANISDTRRLLGFEPSVRLADGLAEALEWYARSAGVLDSKAVA